MFGNNIDVRHCHPSCLLVDPFVPTSANNVETLVNPDVFSKLEFCSGHQFAHLIPSLAMEIEYLLASVLKNSEAAETVHILDELIWEFIHPTWYTF